MNDGLDRWKWSSRGRRSSRVVKLGLERLESRETPASLTVPTGNAAALIDAIVEANGNGQGSNTIILTPGAPYTFYGYDNFWFGANYLPPITSHLTIDGQGALLTSADNGVDSRFFFVSGGFASPGLTPGSLTLRNLMMSGGVAQGGSSNYGGGGLGAGGAVFNMGVLNLYQVTFTNNLAQGGGSAGDLSNSDGLGGGGMGQSSVGKFGGGGFGAGWPNPDGVVTGGAGGSGVRAGGGGGGFNIVGGGSNGSAGGAGGGLSGLGGNGGAYDGTGGGGQGGDGGGGAAAGSLISGTGGNAFGGGGNRTGGGGVGGGGGGQSGGGGFGGGGGATDETPSTSPYGDVPSSAAGEGGFGGGGGGADTLWGNYAGGSRWGGGEGGMFQGGGGAGLGGALFNLYGTITAVSCTFTANSAFGGSGASSGVGNGGAFFNLNGDVTLVNCTGASNNSSSGGDAVYNLSFGNFPDGGAATAVIRTGNSILTSARADHPAVVNNQVDGTATLIATGPNLVSGFANLGGAVANRRFLVRAEPRLGELQNNGGLVPTMALKRGSPAVNAGSNRLLRKLPAAFTDARGAGFRRIVGRVVDLGAYERQPSPTTARLRTRRSGSEMNRSTALKAYVAGEGVKANHSQGVSPRVSG